LDKILVPEGTCHPKDKSSQNLSGATLEERPKLSETIIADLSRQAAVQVISSYFADASAASWALDQDLMEQDIAGFVQEGVITDPNDPDVRALLFVSDPLRYIIKTGDVRIDAFASYGGSGFIVTPQGHIVTNAHVAAGPDISPQRREEVTGDLIGQTAFSLVEEDLNQIAQITGINFDIAVLSDQELQTLQEALQVFHASNIDFDPQTITQQLFVTGIAIPPSPTDPEFPGHEARHATPGGASTGLPFPGRDAAVIKVDIRGEMGQNLPTLPLGGDIGTLNTLDDIIIVGFPGAISENQLFTEVTNPVAFSAKVGGLYDIVGIITPEGTGWTAIQVGTSLSGGISGGPALDPTGKVVGIATFGVIDPETGGSIPGIGFLVPADVIREFLNAGNIQPQESRFTAMYRDALVNLSAGNNEAAQTSLQELQKIYPNNQDIVKYMSRATTIS
jgi:S1-C subfamily serine protease